MSEPDEPIFPVDREQRFPLALLWFTGLSFLAHAATFFLFQVVYPQHVTLPPASPQVTLLTAETPEQEALLRWVAAEDPALVAASLGAEPPGLLELPYRPSYAALRTPPRTPPDTPERPEPPPSPLVLSPGGEPPSPVLSPRPGPVATTVALSGDLRGRTLLSPTGLETGASAPLQPSQFLFALTDRGEARFPCLRQSSGDAHADAIAAAWLAAASFSSGEAPLTWGVATIRWGDEAYAPPRP